MIPAGALLGLLRRGWSGEWRSGSTLVGVSHRWPGGRALLEFEGFGTHEIPQLGAVEVGPLRIEGSEPGAIMRSELLLDLDRIRSHADP